MTDAASGECAAPAAAQDVGDALPRVVLFDFDGVLSRGDAFGSFLRARYTQARWRKGLALLASPWLVLLFPFAPRRALRVLVGIGLLGTGAARYREQALAFADRLVRRPGQFHRGGLTRLRQHQAAGDRVIVVTGCEETLVTAILDGLGIAGIEVLASRLQPGRLGVRPAWHNVGRRKLQSLERHGVTAWQCAYGDSIHDLAMLGRAAEPVLVNATPRLCRRVEKALGRSVARVEWY